ncbi:MAG: hypothetical protein M3Q58_00270 [Bacteroidota bacterium]|jgi:protein-arginine kinase activator protein McsA|nr:hypothetical protein [Bacteroidota bacterium]
MATTEIKKECLHCFKNYTTTKHFGKFCCVNCRVLYNKKLKVQTKKNFSNYTEVLKHLSDALDNIVENENEKDDIDIMLNDTMFAINSFLKELKQTKANSEKNFIIKLKKNQDGKCK